MFFNTFCKYKEIAQGRKNILKKFKKGVDFLKQV